MIRYILRRILYAIPISFGGQRCVLVPTPPPPTELRVGRLADPFGAWAARMKAAAGGRIDRVWRVAFDRRLVDAPRRIVGGVIGGNRYVDRGARRKNPVRFGRGECMKFSSGSGQEPVASWCSACALAASSA
jgi:hypothetical protein